MRASTLEAEPSSLRGLFLGLRRHTSSGLYFPELDGLRFIAILSVFVYHLASDVVRHSEPGATQTSAFFRLARELNIGVPLFFAVSGMILGLPFARYWLGGGPKISLKRYFMRRLTRLEPPYVLSLFLLFAFKLLSGRGTFEDQLPHLCASLLYLHSILFREMSSINPVAWSLEVEVQFYILAPVLAAVFAIRKAWPRRAVICAAIVATAIIAPWTDMSESRRSTVTFMTHLSLAGNIQYFLSGFLLADFYLAKPPATSRDSRWDLVSLVGWPMFAVMVLTIPAVVYVALPGIVLVLYLAAFYGPVSSRAFGSLWVASIGGMCYSIYLLHNYVIAAVGSVTERIGHTFPPEARFTIQAILMTPIVLGFSIVFYKFVEQPCMRPDWPARLRAALTRLTPDPRSNRA